MIFAFLQGFFGLFASSDVVVDLEDRNRLPLSIALKCLATGNGYLPTCLGCVDKFAFPVAMLMELAFYFRKRLGELGLQEGVRHFAQGLLAGPSVALFRSTIPKCDSTLKIANDDRIMGQFEKRRLSLNLLFGLSSLGEIACDFRESEKRAGGISDRSDGYVSPETGTILTHPPTLVFAAPRFRR